MTQTQVRDALIAHLTDALAAHDGLTVTYSFEDAVARYSSDQGWVLVTLMKHEPNGFLIEDNWEFMLQCSKSLQPGAQDTTTEATAADQVLVSDLDAAINDDAGFAALMEAGLYQAELRAGAEDQQSESAINPHVFSCATY